MISTMSGPRAADRSGVLSDRFGCCVASERIFEMTIKALATAILAGSMAIPALPSFAQTPATALNEARVRVACGTGRLISAQRLPSGAVRVTCAQANELTNC